MQPLLYKNRALVFHDINGHKNLLSHKDIAIVCEFLPELLYKLVKAERAIFKSGFHYILYEEELYFSMTGIIRLAMHLGNDESLEFAMFIEKTLMTYQKVYIKLKTIQDSLD